MKQRSDNFNKFANQKKGSAIKEGFRQEKKRIKAEAQAAGEKFRREKADKLKGVRAAQEETTTEKVRKQPNKSLSPRKPSASPAPRNKKPAEQPAVDVASESAAVSDTQMPLNKFIAHAGICGRREAALLVKDGKVVVNGDKIFEPGFKVSQQDKILVKGKQVFIRKNTVYILLNKPKDFITTLSDPKGRKTVLDLLKGATTERIYPVGRLDRNTTGVLLLTNDGELSQKLTHPSFEVKKIYEVTLDKPVLKKDMDTILNGLTLEDGFVKADAIGYAKEKHVVGIEIHSGRNRIVRRIFEHLGYDVRGLDRVMFANLTKKDVDRSKWRFLTEKEIRLLKFMNKSFVRQRQSES